MRPEEYKRIHEDLKETVETVESNHSSGEIKAVLQEFVEKSEHLLQAMKGEDHKKLKEAVYETEQAADSAKVAVQASQDLEESPRRTILEAHDFVSRLKREATP